jgi:hypothetical protein
MMHSYTPLRTEADARLPVTRVTQQWEIYYPFYPAAGGFYNSGGFLYPYSRLRVQT